MVEHPSYVFCKLYRLVSPLWSEHQTRGGMAQSVEHIVHIDGVVGSSPTVTSTNPVGVQVQRLPDFFAYPSRVRRSPENCLLFQISYANNTMLLISRAGGEE